MASGANASAVRHIDYVGNDFVFFTLLKTFLPTHHSYLFVLFFCDHPSCKTLLLFVQFTFSRTAEISEVIFLFIICFCIHTTLLFPTQLSFSTCVPFQTVGGKGEFCWLFSFSKPNRGRRVICLLGLFCFVSTLSFSNCICSNLFSFFMFIDTAS